MKKPFPRWFAALVVAVLLLCSAVVAASLFREAALRQEIADVQTSLNAAQGRLRKQQQEYAEYMAALPAVLQELETVQPQADAAYAQEQLLRQQRKELRAENAALADEIAALQARTAEGSEEVTQTLDAVTQLQNALQAIQTLRRMNP